MHKLSKGEKMMDWVMKHVLPWVMLVMLIFCMVMVIVGMISIA